MFEVVVTDGPGIVKYHGVIEWHEVVDAIEQHVSGSEILTVQVSPHGRQDFHGRWK